MDLPDQAAMRLADRLDIAPGGRSRIASASASSRGSRVRVFGLAGRGI